jgi:NAD(P)-dependent dehydrogenase (short-subunit alcohol dehydrogenase family)
MGHVVTGLAGKTAVVTGAARGIGAGIVRELVELEARVVAVDVSEPALETTFSAQPAVIPWPADIAAADVDQLATAICKEAGPVELVVNNVGIDTPHSFVELDEASFDLVFRTNLRGPWFFTRRMVLDLIEHRRPGSIVFVSSLHDHRIRGRPHYSVSKAGIAMLVKELAQELAPHDIRVNAVSPGVVLSHTVPLSDPAEAERARRFVPMNRPGEPADVARVTAALLSDDVSGYVTGANVPVDGGLDLHSWSTDP